jgi:hypothetical protein
MTNQANGATGLSQYAFRSSWQEYNTAIGTGAIAGAVSVGSIIASGVVAAAGSGLQDRVAGRPINTSDALATGGLTLVGGTAFKGLAGESPAAKFMARTGKTFNQASRKVLLNDARYTVAGETFQTGLSYATNRYMMFGQQPWNQNFSRSQSSSGASSLPATVTQNGITYVRNSSGLLPFAPSR